MGLLDYAGDHLISHTLTRAVPSAQRGLTSVFGMGTGVTLAVNSPANLRRFRSRDLPQLNRLSRHLPNVFSYIAITTKLVLNDSRTVDILTAQSKFYGQAERAISTGKLHALPRFNLQPINQVVFLGPSFPFWVGRSHLRACFPLICIQRLSQPNFATQPCPWQDNWNTRGSSIPVLSY